MKNCNLVIVSGLVTKEPQIIEGKFGPMANLSIEITETKNVKGEFKHDRCRIQCSVMGKQAEKVKELNLNSGNEVFIKGKLRLETWEKDGKKNWMHKIAVEDIWDITGRLDLNQDEE